MIDITLKDEEFTSEDKLKQEEEHFEKESLKDSKAVEKQKKEYLRMLTNTDIVKEIEENRARNQKRRAELEAKQKTFLYKLKKIFNL